LFLPFIFDTLSQLSKRLFTGNRTRDSNNIGNDAMTDNDNHHDNNDMLINNFADDTQTLTPKKPTAESTIADKDSIRANSNPSFNGSTNMDMDVVMAPSSSALLVNNDNVNAAAKATPTKQSAGKKEI
jgi:hypothetical protein